MNESADSIIRMLNAVTNPSLGSFNDRMKLQKLVYLLRELGHDCPYSFDWYVRGPYSPSLTSVLYAADEIGQLRTKSKLKESEQRVVENLKLLLGNDIEDPNTLELLASIWYYLPNELLDDENLELLIDQLTEQKPHFSREDFETGIKRILEFREL